ncbi:MAG: aromatic ring-hydroxylating dioxygenase subunit alpha [Polyangiaceae bacterium]|nr:aromatic ring-hydroxylating dioxygenase subunit alpha [Polyangiaceae bacterium]
MGRSLNSILEAYDAAAPLDQAWTIPSAWYTDPRVFELEERAVFGRTLQPAARADQVAEPGSYVTAEIAGEPIVVVRGSDGGLRAFFNVCRHHAAAVVTEAEGRAPRFRCPYHGWTYSLEGELRGMPEFEGVCRFEKAENGLVPAHLEVWEEFVMVAAEGSPPSIAVGLGDFAGRIAALNLSALRFRERRVYEVACNWKVYVDNYLDGGYHVPHAHKGLHSVLNYSHYTIETAPRACLQSSPINASGGEQDEALVRRGSSAHYLWIYPGFMLNWYEGYMDTNWVIPLAVDRTQVVFDFYFSDFAGSSEEDRRRSIAVAERIQDEDKAICESVQRGLRSRAYEAGRLSVRREAGEHLFHRLLAGDLRGAASTSI